MTVPNAHLRPKGGCLKGDVPPSEAEKFCIFETGIVQFDEYVWAQFRAGSD